MRCKIVYMLFCHSQNQFQALHPGQEVLDYTSSGFPFEMMSSKIRFKLKSIQLSRGSKTQSKGSNWAFCPNGDTTLTGVPICRGVGIKKGKRDVKGEVYENKRSSNHCWNSLWQKEPAGRLGMTGRLPRKPGPQPHGANLGKVGK